MISKTEFIIVGDQNCTAEDVLEKSRLIIFVRHSDRAWLEPKYIDNSIKSKSKVKKVIPNGPSDPFFILDSIISFAPILFNTCTDYNEIIDFLSTKTVIDFDLRKSEIPSLWSSFRTEANEKIKDIQIWKAYRVDADEL